MFVSCIVMLCPVVDLNIVLCHCNIILKLRTGTAAPSATESQWPSIPDGASSRRSKTPGLVRSGQPQRRRHPDLVDLALLSGGLRNLRRHEMASAALRDEDDHYAALIGEVEACAKIAFEIMGLTNVPEDASRLRGASRISASRRRGRTFFG